MKLNIISDIHRNNLKKNRVVWETFDPEKLEPADYLIVAGDLGLKDDFQAVLSDLKRLTSGKFTDVLAVEGNHDLWDFGNGSVSFKKDGPEPPNPENAVKIDVVKDGVAIFGISMWTPLRNEIDAMVVERSMNDFRWIPGWRSHAVQTRYFEWCKKWLTDKYNQYNGLKRVIVTHHGPREELIDTAYADEINADRGTYGLNATYYVCDGSLKWMKPDLWVYGHSHGFKDTTIDGVRYIRNAIGYHGLSWGYSDKFPEVISMDSWYSTVVEV